MFVLGSVKIMRLHSTFLPEDVIVASHLLFFLKRNRVIPLSKDGAVRFRLFLLEYSPMFVVQNVDLP